MLEKTMLMMCPSTGNTSPKRKRVDPVYPLACASGLYYFSDRFVRQENNSRLPENLNC